MASVGVDDGDPRTERTRLIREARQRLESLRRAGVDRLPIAASLPVAQPVESPGPTPAQGRSGATVGVIEPPALRVAPAVVVSPTASAPRPAPAPVVGSLFGAPEIDLPVIAPEERPAALAALASEVAVCARCPHLAASRTQTVFGVGSPTARLMFVGEAPGADEDRTGIPFVGRAGALLTDMITKGMGLTRDEVYIANVLKSRPPENRNPEPPEIANCLPYLERQIAIIRPQFLCLLGKIAASTLLKTALPLGRLRGRWHDYQGIPTVVTYHPAYLLRNPADKKKAWEDLQLLMQAMGLKPPGRRGE